MVKKITRVELFLTEQIKVRRWQLLCLLMIVSVPVAGWFIIVVILAYNIIVFYDRRYKIW